MEIGRLAFRHEGEWWNAYWSPDQHTMDRAVLLGTIRMSVVEGKPEIRNGFVDLMRLAFAGFIAEITGQTPTWQGEKPAPESERSGHG